MHFYEDITYIDILFINRNLLILGLREKEYERVKLHMTVMNTSFKDEKDAYKERFNASEILKVIEYIFVNYIDKQIFEKINNNKTIYMICMLCSVLDL